MDVDKSYRYCPFKTVLNTFDVLQGTTNYCLRLITFCHGVLSPTICRLFWCSCFPPNAGGPVDPLLSAAAAAATFGCAVPPSSAGSGLLPPSPSMSSAAASSTSAPYLLHPATLAAAAASLGLFGGGQSQLAGPRDVSSSVDQLLFYGELMNRIGNYDAAAISQQQVKQSLLIIIIIIFAPRYSIRHRD